MKRIWTLLLICCSTAAMAQMQPAKKIIPDYTHETFIKSSPVKIWRVIRDLPQVKDYSNGTIKDVQIVTENDTRYRDLTFTDNRKRRDIIDQVHESYKFFVFSIVSPLPAGITHATVTALVESLPDKDDTSVVRWSIMLEGDKSNRKPLVDTLSAEIGNYEAGLKKLLQ
jgi:hypothetical protein